MEPNYLRPGAGAELIFLINIYCSQFGGCQDEEKPPLRQIYYGTTTVIVQFLRGNIWPELEPETKLWTKVVPEPKINNFDSATLPLTSKFVDKMDFKNGTTK